MTVNILENEPRGIFETKNLIDAALVKYLKAYIAVHGYKGGLAVHGLLSSIITRAECLGESWAHFYPDDDTYDDAKGNHGHIFILMTILMMMLLQVL